MWFECKLWHLRRKLPTIPWLIGKTGKFVYKFKMSQLEA
jgi:hypothetical protein